MSCVFLCFCRCVMEDCVLQNRGTVRVLMLFSTADTPFRHGPVLTDRVLRSLCRFCYASNWRASGSAFGSFLFPHRHARVRVSDSTQTSTTNENPYLGTKGHRITTPGTLRDGRRQLRTAEFRSMEAQIQTSSPTCTDRKHRRPRNESAHHVVASWTVRRAIPCKA